MILFFLTNKMMVTWFQYLDNDLFVCFSVIGLEDLRIFPSAQVPGKFKVVARTAINQTYP